MSLQTISQYLFQYGGVILYASGVVSCILNVLVFSQKTLRKTPCSLYFIAGNIFNFFFLHTLLLAGALEVGFHIPYSTIHPIFCKLYNYTALFTNSSSSSCLIFASIDRVIVTSPNASTRQGSSRQLSVICIVCGVVFWMLFHISAAIYTNIIQINPSASACFYQGGPYLLFITFYAIVKETLTILALILFGLWAMKNIRRLRRVALPSVSLQSGVARNAVSSPSFSSRDRQFALIILIEILLYVVFCSTLPLYLVYQQITQYQEKSVEQLQIDEFLREMSVFFGSIPFAITCYTNLLVSKAYRNALKDVFLRN